MKKNKDEFIVEKAGKIKAHIVGKEEGKLVFDEIKMIRVYSKDHTLLIMEDFMPVMGEVSQSVELVFDEKRERFDNIHGFYMHKKNEFYLLIESHNQEETVENV